MSVAIVSVFV